jgi:hypothetical protein
MLNLLVRPIVLCEYMSEYHAPALLWLLQLYACTVDLMVAGVSYFWTQPIADHEFIFPIYLFSSIRFVIN